MVVLEGCARRLDGGQLTVAMSSILKCQPEVEMEIEVASGFVYCGGGVCVHVKAPAFLFWIFTSSSPHDTIPL